MAKEQPFKLTQTELKPGVWFSPGFYQAFWDNSVSKRFTPDEIVQRVELKRHRELWVGAIFAASQSLSGVQHFVGLPEDEPPDVEVVKFTETTTKKGTPATALSRIPLEVVRCDVSAGETLLGQIGLKNKKPWEGLSLLIYEYGNTVSSSYTGVYEALRKEKVLLSDIVVVTKVDVTDAGIRLPDGSFTVTSLYPVKGQTLLNVNDSNAFFRYPEVVTKTGLGTGTKWKDMGSYKLLLPTLKAKKPPKN
jgi:hypothetical protein